MGIRNSLATRAISCTGPELRFFEENSVDAGIDDRLDVTLLEVCQIVSGGDNIRHHSSVPNGVAMHRLLSLVEVPLAIPLACEVVLIIAPGNARHEVSGITPPAPRLNTLKEGHPTVVVCSIDHNKVGTDVGDWLPRTCRLERCLLARTRLCVANILRPKQQG